MGRRSAVAWSYESSFNDGHVCHDRCAGSTSARRLLQPSTRVADHCVGSSTTRSTAGGRLGADTTPDGAPGPTLNFEYEANYVAPTWPSVRGEPQIQEHLDIAVDDLEASVRWAVDVGGTVAEYQPQTDVQVMFDPAGHPFCLFL